FAGGGGHQLAVPRGHLLREAGVGLHAHRGTSSLWKVRRTFCPYRARQVGVRASWYGSRRAAPLAPPHVSSATAPAVTLPGRVLGGASRPSRMSVASVKPSCSRMRLTRFGFVTCLSATTTSSSLPVSMSNASVTVGRCRAVRVVVKGHPPP